MLLQGGSIHENSQSVLRGCLLVVVAPDEPGQLQQELGKLPGAQFVADLFHQPSEAQALMQAQPQGQEQQPSGSDSVLGAPTITVAFINNVLAAAGFPAAGTSQSLYDLGVQYGIDPVWALAYFTMNFNDQNR